MIKFQVAQYPADTSYLECQLLINTKDQIVIFQTAKLISC